MDKKNPIILGWVTLLGFGGLGFFLIYHFHNISPWDLLVSGEGIHIQLIFGLAFGTLSSICLNKFMKFKFLEKEKDYYQKLYEVAGLHKLSFPGMVFVAFCAGFGEEIFFRGFLQPYMGIWLTSIIFVAVHSYLDPRRPIFFIGLILVLIIAGIGWLYDHSGPWAAISAHFIIDLIAFINIKADASDFDETLLRS